MAEFVETGDQDPLFSSYLVMMVFNHLIKHTQLGYYLDYFRKFEDESSIQSHAWRVSGLLKHVSHRVIRPPIYDPRSIVDLLEKFGDAH